MPRLARRDRPTVRKRANALDTDGKPSASIAPGAGTNDKASRIGEAKDRADVDAGLGPD
jgi:hypothetical protein